MVDEALKRLVWKFIFVGKIKIVKNLIQLRAIRDGDLSKTSLSRLPISVDVFLLPPRAIARYLKAMVIVDARKFLIMKLLDHLRILFIPHIAHAFIEKEAKNVFL